MSVKMIKSKENEWLERLETVSKDEMMYGGEYVERLHALIEIVQHQNEDALDHGRNYYVLQILADMMPTPEQARKMFDCEH